MKKLLAFFAFFILFSSISGQVSLIEAKKHHENKDSFLYLLPQNLPENAEYLGKMEINNQGMDETAANKASCEIMKEIAAQSDNDVKKYQDLIKELVDGQGLADTLCKFWGLYIFEHLSQRFEEKIQQQKGEEVSKETFKIIKDDILGRVKVLNTQRAVSKIDWNKAEGRKEIEKIFDSIIKIICNEKN